MSSEQGARYSPPRLTPPPEPEPGPERDSYPYPDGAASSPPGIVRRIAWLLLAGALYALFAIPAWRGADLQSERVTRALELAAGPQVRVARIIRSPGEQVVNVIGEALPYQTATLYAQVSGYLKAIYCDKGDAVKKGQLLAEIESPKTDDAYEAAFSEQRNKVGIARRMESLNVRGLASQQDTESVQSDAKISTARLHSQAIEKAYEMIRAPFDGTVTARYADPGALVQNATSSHSGALPIVTVSDINHLRVDVFIDQREAPFVRSQDPVEISLTERPGHTIRGVVARVSGQLDPRTKMLLTEIDIPNDDRSLVAGSFVQVALHIQSPIYSEAPVEALVLKANKPYLTMITAENLITYRPIVIADNDGKSLRLVSGAEPGELVALNVGDSIPEGGRVRPLTDEPLREPGPGPSVPLQARGAAEFAPARPKDGRK
jgi:membrane fusion protein, multidrug efflux system